MQFFVNCLRICIDEIDSQNNVSGRICGIAVQEIVTFDNDFNLILAIDKILDDIGQPQPTKRLRSFEDADQKRSCAYCANPVKYHTNQEISALSGQVRTLDVIFHSRQHNSWQGIVTDSTNGIATEFQSELELTRFFFKDK